MFFSGIADEAGKPIETQVRAHQELGWNHIELRNVNETTPALASDAEFDRIRSALDQAQLKVSCFSARLSNWSRDIKGPFDDDKDELRRSIPRMRRLGTPFIRAMSWANKSKVSDSEWRKAAIVRMRELTKMAEDGGVVIVHENCDGWAGLSPENTLAMLGEINSPALKLVYDTGNPVMHGQDGWDFYRKVREHIVYVHIKDGVPGAEGKTIYGWAGEGKGRVKEILADLFQRGYDGGFSIEPHLKAVVHTGETSNPDEMFRAYVEYGRRFMALVDATKTNKQT